MIGAAKGAQSIEGRGGDRRSRKRPSRASPAGQRSAVARHLARGALLAYKHSTLNYTIETTFGPAARAAHHDAGGGAAGGAGSFSAIKGVDSAAAPRRPGSCMRRFAKIRQIPATAPATGNPIRPAAGRCRRMQRLARERQQRRVALRPALRRKFS